MAYIPENLKWTVTYVQDMNNRTSDEVISVDTLIGVYHAYNRNTPGFDDGLGLLDSLWKKLHVPFRLDWNVNLIKNMIRDSYNPPQEYVNLLQAALTPEMIEYYGC